MTAEPRTSAAFNRKEILAASAPWLGAVLNVLPGLGTGYIYQRRWRAYWITALLAVLWIGLEGLAGRPTVGSLSLGMPILGLLGLAASTAVEAFLAGRRARMD